MAKGKIKKFLIAGMTMIIMGTMFTACGSGSKDSIGVTSREDGSGTRGAFIELFGIETKDAAGVKTDNTINTSEVTNSTSVMMTTIAGNEQGIGYISLGSLNDAVKALQIDGVDATAANIENGTYKISRPFTIVTGKKLSAVAQDFVNYILSSDGQAVIEADHYIKASDKGSYTSKKLSGKIVVAGSSSVTPVMEKLKEAYVALNPDVTVEVQQSDSTTGVTSTIEGVCDIGMASRALADTELAKGVTGTTIATDGIAVIVNNNNKLVGLTSQQVLDIYTGKLVNWADIK